MPVDPRQEALKALAIIRDAIYAALFKIALYTIFGLLIAGAIVFIASLRAR